MPDLFYPGIVLIDVAVLLALTLPADVTAALRARYPGHRIAPVAPQIDAWFKEYGFGWAPSVMPADFNGDGAADWAVQIVTTNNRQVLVAAVQRGGKWELHELADDAPDPFTYLLLYKKGDKDFDFETLKPFRHASDAIGLMYFARTPLSFSWRNGKFRSKLTPSDEE